MIATLWKNSTYNAKTLYPLTSISLFTIYYYIRKLKKNISLEPLSQPGRPKRLSPKKRHHLEKLVSANKFSTCAELANILNEKYTNLDISKRTVLNELYSLNYI
ncbi:16661_t:CDS:1, partial [Funneliformis caledonium]